MGIKHIRTVIENFRIRVFRTVARQLNFSRAADELFLTQPAITQQVKALEEEIGTPLFDRSGGRITLTQAGKALLPFAEKVKQISDQAFAAVAAVSGDQAGELQIGASQTIAQYLLPTFVAGFTKANPRVRITVRTGNTEAILEALVAHQIQLALIEGPDRRKDLRIESFLEDFLVMVVPPGHVWADRDIEVQALKQEPLLMREPGSGSRRIVERAVSAAGLKLKELNIHMQLDSTEGLLSAVEAGLGVAFVSRWAVRNQLSLGTLKVARVRDLKLSRKFSLAYSAGPELAGNAGAFRRFLLSQSLDLRPRPTGSPSLRVLST